MKDKPGSGNSTSAGFTHHRQSICCIAAPAVKMPYARMSTQNVSGLSRQRPEFQRMLDQIRPWASTTTHDGKVIMTVSDGIADPSGV